MKIIFSGNANREKYFECSGCGCIFEANNDEYKEMTSMSDGYYDPELNYTYYLCFCPECGKECKTDDESWIELLRSYKTIIEKC